MLWASMGVHSKSLEIPGLAPVLLQLPDNLRTKQDHRHRRDQCSQANAAKACSISVLAAAMAGRRQGKDARRPVSRVLSRPLRAMDDHSSGTSVTGRLARPTRAAAAETRLADAGPEGPVGRPPLCGLAPGGVYHAVAVAGGAVRSYRTLSPLPPRAIRRSRWARRFAFCGTFPGVAPAGRYPAPCFRGARTFLPPTRKGRRAAIRPSGGC